MNTAKIENIVKQSSHISFVEKDVEYWREKGYEVTLLHDELILSPKK